MKNFTFITLVSLSLTVAASAAVQNNHQNDDALVTLPDYAVSAARHTPAEKAIAQSLAAFQAEALAATPIRTPLESLGTVAGNAPKPQSRDLALTPLRRTQGRS